MSMTSAPHLICKSATLPRAWGVFGEVINGNDDILLVCYALGVTNHAEAYEEDKLRVDGWSKNPSFTTRKRPRVGALYKWRSDYKVPSHPIRLRKAIEISSKYK